MTEINKSLVVIGRAEEVVLRTLDNMQLTARIDTGAKTSSISAQNVHIKDGVLYATFLDEARARTREYRFEKYGITMVSSSNGHVEERFKVTLQCELQGRIINASFTLTDRTSQVYPVLVGRNILRGKFIVDVRQGKPLLAKEKLRTRELRARLKDQRG